jgi:sigma-B regulation protein RsbU (phosphoserine phosphatase)
MSGAAVTGEAPVQVLVVDDSSFNRLLLRRRLAELGYDAVTMANDGVEALAALESRAFDVMLLDLEMPELDGIGVLERMRAEGRTEPPVIVISALSDMAGVVRCIELGAEDYLPKSFDPPLLRARLSAVLEKKRLRDLAAQRLSALEAELESARRAQLSLVPSDFASIASARLALHAVMVPARQVGGDLYDAMRLDARRLMFCIGDVSGKGAPAALTMARTLGVVRSAARQLAEAAPDLPDPGAILALANEELVTANETQTFVTVLLGTLDVETGEGLVCVAGHDPAVLLAEGAAPRLLTPAARQPALGMMEGIRYRSEALRLAPGEGLFLYTDGVTEAEDQAGAFYTRDRLLARLAGLGGSPAPEAAVRAVMQDLEGFAGGAAQSDDITALALRFG